MEENSPIKFYCPSCQKEVEVSRAMCVECGKLIACTAISHDQAQPFHGCGDNGILTSEILKLSREKNNLIAILRRIVLFPLPLEMTYDFRVMEAVAEVQQIAKNGLKDFESDSLL